MIPAYSFSPSNLENIINKNILTHDILYFYTLPQYLILTSVVCLFLVIILLSIKILFIYKLTKEENVFLEITPPSNADQSSYSTEQLFTTLHSLGSQIPFIQGYFGKKKLYSLELVSTKNEGIRYLLRTNSNDASVIEKNISSHLPGATIKKAKDYLTLTKDEFKKSGKVVEFRLTKNFVMPLQKQSSLTESDPIAYFTNHMTKMIDGELVAFQIVLTPISYKTHHKETNVIQNLNNQILKGLDISTKIKNASNLFPFNYLLPLARLVINCIVFVILTPFTFLSSLLNNKSEMFPLWLFSNSAPKVQHLSERQLNIQKIVGEKIGEELFETSIRILLIQDNKASMKERLKGLLSTFSFYTNAGYQSLIAKRQLPFITKNGFIQTISYFLLKNRLLSFTSNPILSVSELSSIFHLPYFPTNKTEDVVKRRNIILPAPLHLKQTNTKLDITFAKNDYGNKETPIGLTAQERYRHMYILGATGTGKTTLLSTMIYKDIHNNKGVCVIDPHGDLMQKILGTIPKNRIKDVVYFNPLDRNFPVGLNILELSENLSAEEREEEKDIITSSIISIFHKLYSEKYLGPRMEHILRFAILTALETERPTLFTIQKILTDNKYRNRIIATLKDPVVKDFWLHEFRKFGSYQQADAIFPITNKLGRFLSSPLCRNILGQARSTIDFEKIINEGKILLCNLPKGGIGEDNSTFFGTLITAKIQLAALKRSKIPEKERRGYYLYIDEFQNFAMPSFTQIMSESRKYGLYAVLAHQTIAQLTDHDVPKVILANTGTVISFRTSSPLDEEFILPFFTPLVKKGDIANLPSFSFYIKINAMEPRDTFSGTVDQFPYEPDENIAREICAYSQEAYGVPRQQVIKEIEDYYIQFPKQRTRQKTTKTTKTVTPKMAITAGTME